MGILKNCLFAFFTGALATGCVSPQKADQEQLQGAKFRICDSEGNIALTVGRMYFLDGKNKEKVSKNVNIQRSRVAKDFLNEISDREATGGFRHYADFATDKLYACAQREGLNIGKPRELARVCYARVDIPFFLIVLKEQGMEKKQAIDKVLTMFKQRTIYPEKLIISVADVVYSPTSGQENQKLMGMVFWSCLYQWQSKPNQ